MASSIQLQLSSGQALCAPATLRSATTYVVLEQGGWFEKEWPFVVERLRPGIAIDIGANLGVYAVPLAAGGASVFAYEPAAETRALLEESRRINGLEERLTPIGRALSNRSGEGRLLIHPSGGEYNSLSQGASGEAIELATLDSETERLGWTAVDFVKLDAEGEELNILEGGAYFFERFSPLVLFETNHAGVANTGLREAFEARGYALYRLLGDGSALVPLREDEHQEAELNLFAARPDRARALEEQGLLCPETQDGSVAADGWRWVLGEPYVAAFALGEPTHDYALILSALGLWRDRSRPLGLRWSALRYAVSKLGRLCAAEPTAWRLSTLARAEFELGRRNSALAALHALKTTDRIEPREPFLSPCPRYDAIDPAGRENDWFAAAILEQLERLSSFSSAFHESDPLLAALCSSEMVSTEMLRRQALQSSRRGEVVPAALCERIRAGGEVNGEMFTQEAMAALDRG